MYQMIYFSLILLIILSASSADETNPGHMKPFGLVGPFLKIDESESLSTIDFFNNYVKPKKAIVLRNAAKDWPATKLWNDAYLYEKVNGLENYMFQVETVKKESRDQRYEEMSFQNFLKLYRSKELYMVSDVPNFFLDDFNLPQPLQCEHAHEALDKMVLWFSSGDTKSVIHTDEYENILCIVEGIKEVKLVDSNKYPEGHDALIDRPDGAYSSADVDKVDFTKYPGIEKFEYYSATLNKGDCLYIPFKWIHQVRSYNRNIAVNFWFNYEKLFEHKEFTEACKKNQFDPTQTLNKLDLKINENSEEAGEFTNFKYWLIRQINAGHTQISHWVSILVEEHLPENKSIDDYPLMKEEIKEFFDTLDYDGDGEISKDELRQIDVNRLEHLAFIIEDLDQELSKIFPNQEVNDTEDNSKEEL